MALRIDAGGRATLRCAVQDMGMGTATSQTQLAAERLGLPLDRVRFEYGDSALPDGTPAAGSGQLVSVSAAVQPAAEALFRKLVKLAGRDSPLHGAKVPALEARDGGLYLRGSARGESYAAILARAGVGHVEAEAKSPLPF